VRVRGPYKLVINLILPDGKFLTILTMPFFQATSAKVPLTQEVADVRSMDDLPSAGPYAFTLNDVNVATKIRRNPFWKRGPGRTAPRNLSGLDIYWNLNEQEAFEQVKDGRLDEGPIPAAEVQGVANRYGVNRSRFWAEPVNCLGSIPFNTSNGLFADNAPMRKAVNWALDRTDYVAVAAPHSQSPWTHLLPPNVAGSITKKKLQPYATTSRIEKARALAAGHFKDGRVIVAYRSPGGASSARAELVRRDLIRLGFDPANIEMKPFDDPPVGAWDLMVGLGWCADLPDPASFIRGAYLPLDSTYQAKLDAADHLRGNARLKALGKLDLEITKKVAPVAVMNTYNNRFFFSARVNPRSLKYHRVYQDWSIPSLALK
jgi:ABC-type oligopeptide transport system substrate-binding subunit